MLLTGIFAIVYALVGAKPRDRPRRACSSFIYSARVGPTKRRMRGFCAIRGSAAGFRALVVSAPKS